LPKLTQLSGAGGGYVGNRMHILIFSTGTEENKFSFVNYILPGPGVYYQTSGFFRIYIMFTPQEYRISEIAGSFDRQRITAKHLRQS
jgi:hypothetical protein